MHCFPLSVAFRPRFPITRLVDAPSLNHVRVVDEVQLSCDDFRLNLAAVLTFDLGIRRYNRLKKFRRTFSIYPRTL